MTVRTFVVVLLLVVPGGLLAAGAAPFPQTAAAQQEASVAQQMAAIAQSSAQKQADSIRMQAASFERQAQQSAPAPAALAVSEQTKPIEPPAPVRPPAGAAERTQTVGFYSTPWPTSSDFVMPNVQVETRACDPMAAADVDALVKSASAKNQIKPELLRAVMVQESGLRPCAISTAGAMGLMQIMPETADDLGLNDPFDPGANVDAGARYLKLMLDRYHGNTALALAAYNAGPGRTDKANGVPEIPETIGYVSKILSSMPLF